MRSLIPTRARTGRRALGLVIAVVAVLGLGACSDSSEPDTPAISGGSPGEVTVPTLPPTTTEATDDAGVGGGDEGATTDEAPTETTVPAVGDDATGSDEDTAETTEDSDT